MPKPIVFIDSEIGIESQEILDLGAVKEYGGTFHPPPCGISGITF